MPHPNASFWPLKEGICSAPFINLLITKLISISVTARLESISKSWPGCLATFVVRFLLDHVSNQQRWSSYYLNKSNIKGTAVGMGALLLLTALHPGTHSTPGWIPLLPPVESPPHTPSTLGPAPCPVVPLRTRAGLLLGFVPESEAVIPWRNNQKCLLTHL